MSPVSSAEMKASWMRNINDANRRAPVKQMLILADRVERRALAGSKNTRVKMSPMVEIPRRTYVR